MVSSRAASPSCRLHDSRFLEASPGTFPTEFLRLHPPGVRDQQSSVILDEDLAEFKCGCSIYEDPAHRVSPHH